MNPILVAGTWSWGQKNDVDWYCPGHPFGTFLTDHGAPPTYDNSGACGPATGRTSTGPRYVDQPFIWSTDLNGLPWRGKKDWRAGGAALTYFVTEKLGRRSDQTALILHSHALQVGAFAALEHGLKAAVVITVGSPIRKDMRTCYEALRRNCGYWLHLHSDLSDHWEILGEMFDGSLHFTRTAPLADQNDFVPNVGHSELLRDPTKYHFWLERGWIDRLAGPVDLNALKQLPRS